MQREMMKLQQEEGFNPLAGCLPIFIQIPVFIGLFHVLRHLAAAASTAYQFAHPGRLTLYSFTRSETLSAANAKLFGAPLAGRLNRRQSPTRRPWWCREDRRLVIVILVLLSAAATLVTQVLARRGQTTAPDGTAATVQMMLLVIVPLSTLASGLFFPLGVLLYWFTSNAWTTGQQIYINRPHPTPPPSTEPPHRPASPHDPNGPAPNLASRHGQPNHVRNGRPQSRTRRSKRR